MSARLIVGLALAMAVSCPLFAHAHPLAPVVLFVEEQGEDMLVRVKRARAQPTGAAFEARVPAGCERVSPPTVTEAASYVIEQSRFRCSEGLAPGWAGAEFGVDGLSEAGVDAVVRVTLMDGSVSRGLLDRSEDVFIVPERGSLLTTTESFVRGGFSHLLGGLDHVLLVLGLVLLLGDPRRIFLALTAFTLGHGLSMCAATFGWIVSSAYLAEIAIALTLLWLAREIVRHREGPAGLRQPYVASFAVGLVHGLGFASAFAGAGMSGLDLGLALGAFHVGIELGQGLIVGAALLLMWLARPHREPMQQLAGYATGAIAFMWVIERVVQS